MLAILTNHVTEKRDRRDRIVILRKLGECYQDDTVYVPSSDLCVSKRVESEAYRNKVSPAYGGRVCLSDALTTKPMPPLAVDNRGLIERADK